jgi:glycosyltransferase involved in cell wall biosynthesis
LHDMSNAEPSISIVVPVYDEEEVIGECADALVGQDYPEDRYEIIVVNDGSSDGTAGEVQQRDGIRLIDLPQNRGRIHARITGAREAVHGQILFIDSRRIAPPGLLSGLAKRGYQPVAVPSPRNPGNPFERVLYRLRDIHYVHERGTEYWVKEENFDAVGKGTGCLYIEKELFMRCQPKERDRWVNDDTKILCEVVKERPILVLPSPAPRYRARRASENALWHLFERGPRFQDYYLGPGGLYHRLWLGCLTAAGLAVAALVAFPGLWVYYLVAALALLVGGSAWLAHDVKEFGLCLVYLPPILLAFGSGIVYGKLRAYYHDLIGTQGNETEGQE